MDEEIKVTKLTVWPYYDVSIIVGVHFKFKGEDYFLHYSNAEYEEILYLYKGRCRGQLTRISSTYAYGQLRDNYIRFIRKPWCLKYIDTKYFIEKLKERGLWL